MRVGVITPRHPPTEGGGVTFHETIINSLKCIKTDHEFILLDIVGDIDADWSVAGLPFYNVKVMFPLHESNDPEVPITDLAVKKLGLDVVWYLDPKAEVLSVPVFATVLDLAHRQHPFFPEVTTMGWKWEARETHYARVLPRASRIFAGTETGKNQIVRCYGVNPKNVVVNPFPVSNFARFAERDEDSDVLMKYGLQSGYLFYPAQFWAHKNHVNLLIALAELESKHGLAPELVLTGADHGNLEHVRRTTEDLGLQQRVRFLGFVPSDHMVALYKNAAMLVYPSFFGPDNLPPLEAFSLGCPVATALLEGTKEQLGELASGYFDPTKPEDIADVVFGILNDKAYREKIIENGYALAAIRTPEAYVRVVLDNFDEFGSWRRNWPSTSLNSIDQN